MFAAIYLHELDHFLTYVVRVSAWIRYGDDVVIFGPDEKSLHRIRLQTADFLRDNLRLTIHPVHDTILPCRAGLYVLGWRIRAHERRIFPRTWRRIRKRLATRNVSSYAGLLGWETIHQRRKEWAYRVSSLFVSQ